MVVVDEGFRVFLCDTRTGNITLDVTPAGYTFGQRLNKPGPLSLSLPAHAEEYVGINLRSHTQPLDQCLGVSYGGRILECGPIWTRDYDGSTLSITADGIGSLFDRRKAVRGSMLVKGAKVTASTLKLTGSLSDIARELVRISLHDNPYLPGPLNNILLPDTTGGTHERNIPGYELRWIGSVLTELSSGQDGIDIRFRPRFMGDEPNRVEWVMETGAPLLEQEGADWVWDGGVEGSGLGAIPTSEDATTMGGFAFMPGDGQEQAMKLATAVNQDYLDNGHPWLELDEAAKEIADQNILDSHADRLLEDGESPWITFGVEVRADIPPLLGEYLPGEWAQIIVPEDHPTMDPGPTRVRIMAVDGQASNKVKLTVAPFQDTVPDNGGEGSNVVDSNHPGHLPGSWAALADGTWNELPAGTWNEVL